jgi:electron transport complex protein RnfG
MSNWNKIFKPIVVLCAICIVITGALAATNSVTAPII